MEILRTGPLFGLSLFAALSLAGTAEAHREGMAGVHHPARPHGMMAGDGAASSGRPGWVMQNGDGIRPEGLMPPRLAADERPAQPYMMNYTDEAAQKLGFKGGGGNVITLHATEGGSLGLTMARGRPMLAMQWHLGP